MAGWGQVRKGGAGKFMTSLHCCCFAPTLRLVLIQKCVGSLPRPRVCNALAISLSDTSSRSWAHNVTQPKRAYKIDRRPKKISARKSLVSYLFQDIVGNRRGWPYRGLTAVRVPAEHRSSSVSPRTPFNSERSPRILHAHSQHPTCVRKQTNSQYLVGGRFHRGFPLLRQSVACCCYPPHDE